MRKRRQRRWHHGADEDPGAGLLNLFDVWIAFAVALLLAIVSYGNLAKKQDASLAKSQGDPGMEKVPDQGAALEHYRPSEQTLGGEGHRLGTAYRLKSGEVIYVPDSSGGGPRKEEANSPAASGAQRVD